MTTTTPTSPVLHVRAGLVPSIDQPWNHDSAADRAAFYNERTDTMSNTPYPHRADYETSEQGMTEFLAARAAWEANTMSNTPEQPITVDELIEELRAFGMSTVDAARTAQSVTMEIYDNCDVCDEVDTLSRVILEGRTMQVCDVCFDREFGDQ